MFGNANELRVVFRVDSSNEIGNGHVIRCLTLAKSLKLVGIFSTFICRDLKGNLIHKIRSEGFSCRNLDKFLQIDSILYKKSSMLNIRGSLNSQTDAHLTRDIIKRIKPNLLIVDNYSIDYHWENLVSDLPILIFVIDDLFNRNHNCKFILDHNFSRTEYDYYSLVPDDCKIFAGSKYALIREEILTKRRQRQFETIKVDSIKLLVSMGGSDANNYTLQILQALQNTKYHNKLDIKIIVGPNFQWLNIMNEYIEKSSMKLTLYSDPSNFETILDGCDFAIGAGGGSALERCCMGLPSLILTVADNQLNTAKMLSEAGAAIWLNHSNDLDKSIEYGLDALLCPANYNNMCLSALSIVDGRGASRVAEIIREIVASN